MKVCSHMFNWFMIQTYIILLIIQLPLELSSFELIFERIFFPHIFVHVSHNLWRILERTGQLQNTILYDGLVVEQVFV